MGVACLAPLSTTISRSLLKFMSIELVMLSNHLIFCAPTLLLPSIYPSIRVFSNESALCIRWPKYWSFSISPPYEYSGLISLRIDCIDLLAVQRTLKDLLQYHRLKASILWRSAFFMIQVSHLYTIIAFTIQTFVGKVMSLLFNMMSRFVITFLPRSKSFNFMAAVTVCRFWSPRKENVTASTFSPSICHEVMGPDSMILVCLMLFHTSFFTLLFHPLQEAKFLLLSAIRVVSSAYLRLLIFHPAILIPACASSSPAFCMIYSAYKLNR